MKSSMNADPRVLCTSLYLCSSNDIRLRIALGCRQYDHQHGCQHGRPFQDIVNGLQVLERFAQKDDLVREQGFGHAVDRS